MASRKDAMRCGILVIGILLASVHARQTVAPSWCSPEDRNQFAKLTAPILDPRVALEPQEYLRACDGISRRTITDSARAAGYRRPTRRARRSNRSSNSRTAL